MILPGDWNLRQWHDWLLEEFGLKIGQDYQWAWHQNHWAIEFRDDRQEILVQLKYNNHK